MSTFNKLAFTPFGIVALDSSIILQQVQNDWINAFASLGVLNVDESTPQGQLIVSQTNMVVDEQTLWLEILQQFNINTATGIWLNALGNIILGRTQKQANSTQVTCQLTGLAGTVINGLDTVDPAQASDGTYTYSCKTTTTIGLDGTGIAIFVNDITGALPCPANTLNTIVTTTVSGWDTINNATSGVVGSDAETESQYRFRLTQTSQINGKSIDGTIESGVFQLEGVQSCVVRSNRTKLPISIQGVVIDGNSACCSVLGGDNTQIGNILLQYWGYCGMIGNTDITVVDPTTQQSYTMTIMRPTEIAFAFRITLSSASSVTTDVQDYIKDIIYSNFYGELEGLERIQIGSTTFASRFFQDLTNNQNFKIIKIEIGRNGSSITYGDTLTINLDEYASLLKMDINFIVGS